ncbi:SMI1/KNR4 family protein [Streptomyces sp. NBC_00708]
MDVEISSRIRDTALQLGVGVPYALKVLAGQLSVDPDMGKPLGQSDVLTVFVDGDLYEDCPALIVGYLRKPTLVEIRYVKPASSAEPAAEAVKGRAAEQDPGPVAETLVEREVRDAWQRVTCWLQRHAPRSHAALRAGASDRAITNVEHDLGVQVPVALRALWSLSAGDDGVNGAGCLPGNQALMPLGAVADLYQRQMEFQAHQDSLNSSRAEYDRITVWRPGWIPVSSYGPADQTSGLYLDTETGYMGRWSRYNEGQSNELDTLVTYVEDVADMLEAPSLATRDKPGLVDETLVWGSRIDPGQEDRWQPLTG